MSHHLNESDALLAPPRTLSPVSTSASHNRPLEDDVDSIDHNDRRGNNDDDDDDDDDRVSVTSTITSARTVS